MPYTWQATYKDLIIALGYALEDAVEGTSTALGTTTTMVDTTKGGADSDWNGSELFFYDTTGGHRVTAYTSASGTFTFTPALATAVASGTGYLLGNIKGQGFPHARKVQALQHALRLAQWNTDATATTVATVASTWEYVLPTTLATIYRVELMRTGATEPYVELAPSKWRIRQDTRTLVLSGATGGLEGYTLRLTGRSADAVPTAMTDIVRLPSEWVVDTAAQWLLRSRGNPAERQLAAALYADLARRAPRLPWRANEVSLNVVA